MRISDLIRLGKSAFLFALVIAIMVLLMWFVKNKLVDKKGYIIKKLFCSENTFVRATLNLLLRHTLCNPCNKQISCRKACHDSASIVCRTNNRKESVFGGWKIITGEIVSLNY